MNNINEINTGQEIIATIQLFVENSFAVHFLKHASKAPVEANWSQKPRASLETLKKTYRDGNNVGVRLGKWSQVGGGYLHTIDMDIRDPALADQARAKLSELLPDWKSFPIVQSGSGGESRHAYLITDRPFPSKSLAHSAEKIVGKDGKSHWAWEIELFGTGKQVAIPPSIHPDTGKRYKWLREFDFDLLEFGIGPFVPSARIAALVEFEDDNHAPSEDQSPLGLTIDEVRDLLKRLPNEDADYDEWLNVMASVQHEAIGRSKEERKLFYEAFRVWSARSNKHDDRTAKYKFFSFKNQDTRRNRTMRSIQIAVRSLELDKEFDDLGDEDGDDLQDDIVEDLGGSDFDDLLGPGAPVAPISKRQQKLNKAAVEAELGHVPPRVKRLNRRHAVAFINGKTVIITEKHDGSVAYGTVGDLHNYYENDRVATEKATEPVTKAWMRHKKRREYPEGVVFSPGREVEGAYNHWRGFSVEPDPKASCKLILRHIWKVICKKDQAAYDYFIGWLAHMIQRPEEKPGVAVVLRGRKGAGKDTVADYVGALFPHHHVKIANQDQLVGKFNAHQEKCLLLHVEEGFWAGNKNAEGPLKHLITSEKVLIEPKGINAFHVTSVLRLFMSSNEDWVVPATNDERRYFVLDVDNRYCLLNSSDEERGAYFDAIRHEMNHGGKAALLHFLQNYDLSDFNVRAVPNTAALAQQKVQGLRNIEKWWFGMLETGELTGMELLQSRGRSNGEWVEGPVRVARIEFRENYEQWMRSRRFDGETLSAAIFGKRLIDVCPDLQSLQGREGNERFRIHVVPSLADCRRAFERWLGSTLPWDAAEPIEPDEQDSDFTDLLGSDPPGARRPQVTYN